MPKPSDALPALRACSTQTWQEQRIKAETNRVFLMLADSKEIDLYLDGNSNFMFDPSYWESQKLYHLFCFLCWNRSDREPPGLLGRLRAQGNAIIERRKSADSTDRLEF